MAIFSISSNCGSAMAIFDFPQLTVWVVIVSLTTREFCGSLPVLRPEYAQRAPLEDTNDGLVKGSDGG